MSRKYLKLEDIPRYESLIFALKKAKKDMEKAKYRLRDLALATILIFTGCRLGEALKLKVSNIDTKTRTVKIFQEKKGRIFYRIIPVPVDLFWEIIERYLRRFPTKESRLFPISDRQARNIIYKFTKRYLRKKTRPHAIRHSYAIFIARTIRDLETVRRLLGHSGYTWLREYLNYTQEDLEEDLREAFRKIEE